MKKQSKLLERNIIQQLMKSEVTKFHMTAEVISVQSELPRLPQITEKLRLHGLRQFSITFSINCLGILKYTVKSHNNTHE
jgi:hypothetical protein